MGKKRQPETVKINAEITDAARLAWHQYALDYGLKKGEALNRIILYAAKPRP